MPRTFEHQSFISAPVDAVIAFHQDPRALARLTMPPARIQVLRDERTSLTQGQITFRLWLGPLPLEWVAEHAPGPLATGFTDRMLRGPLAAWEHQHLFEPVGDGTRLVDRITFAHRSGLRGLLTRLVFDGLPLRLMFVYRHWRTRRSVTAV